MTSDDDLVNRVRAALARVRGKMCVSARAERIMCRIDPALHDAAVKRKGCKTMVLKGRKYRGYVHVDAIALKTKAALMYWVDLALAPGRRA